MALGIRQACPGCQQEQCVQIKERVISCTKCDFQSYYLCPCCQESIEGVTFESDKNGPFYQCPKRKVKIYLSKIVHLIDNRLEVDMDETCTYCQSPMVHRPQANLGKRCVFYPRCSGQASLFGEAKESFVFLDFETSGLEVDKNHIIEIGALKVDEEGVDHTFESLIKPPEAISPKITSITGITNEDLINAPLIEDKITELYHFIGESTLVIHNAKFDAPWLKAAYKKAKLKVHNNAVICTLEWARNNQEGRCSLGRLTKKYGIGHANAHRALADAGATREIFFIYEQEKKTPRPVTQLEGY